MNAIVTVDFAVDAEKFNAIKRFVAESFDNNPQYNLGMSLNGAQCSVEIGDFTSVCIPGDEYAGMKLLAGINAILDGEDCDS